MQRRHGGGYDPDPGGYRQANYVSDARGTPNWRWWIPAEGIARDVIQADIQRYLGPEALVRPGDGVGDYAVRSSRTEVKTAFADIIAGCAWVLDRCLSHPDCCMSLLPVPRMTLTLRSQ